MIALLALLILAPADTLYLDECYALAEAHYPRRQELALQDRIAQLRLDNLDTRFLPALSIQSQATYQSAIPSFPISIPGATPPEISNDQYRVSLNVDQMIYDGGATHREQAIERVQRDLARQSVQVELYQLRDQVNVAYFGALAAAVRIASLQTLAADLEARHRRLEAQVRAGVVTPDNADVIAVERLKVAQQITAADADRRSALAVLGELLGRGVDDATLAIPASGSAPGSADARRRPEYAVFDLNRALLAEQSELAGIRQRPHLVGFLETAYGRPPGLDLFDNSFQPFYSFGLRVKWSFWDWHASRRDRLALTLRQDVVTAQDDAFTQRLDVAARRYEHDIESLEALLDQDDEIIILRERITSSAASQLENGVATATDYLIERNAEYQARLTRDLHALQLARTRVEYATAMGGED